MSPIRVHLRLFAFCSLLALAHLSVETITAGCGQAPIPPPSAYITAEPGFVCYGDDFRTTIHLSGLDSAPSLTLIPVPPSPDDPTLSYEWSLRGAVWDWVEGEPHSAEIAVTTAGDRPLHVALTVTTSDGGEMEALRTIAITMPADHACEEDSECEPCAICDTDGGFCVPGEPTP